MSFCLDMPGVPYVHSYAGALALHARATKPVTHAYYGGDTNHPGAEFLRIPRGSHRAKDETAIAKLADGSIVLRWYRAEMVTWHPDNTITLDTRKGYVSVSDSVFMNRFTPHRIWTTYGGRVLSVGDYFYSLEKATVRLTTTGEFVTGPTSKGFYKFFLDRKKAKALLAEYNYPAFAAWYRAMRPLMKDSAHRDDWFNPAAVDLRDENEWPNLLRNQYFNGEPRWGYDHKAAAGRQYVQLNNGEPTLDGFLRKLRETIYRTNEGTERTPYYVEHRDRLPIGTRLSEWRRV